MRIMGNPNISEGNSKQVKDIDFAMYYTTPDGQLIHTFSKRINTRIQNVCELEGIETTDQLQEYIDTDQLKDIKNLGLACRNAVFSTLQHLSGLIDTDQ